MKIGLYVPSWPPGKRPNGIVTYASQIVPALRKRGHDVFIITPEKTDDDPRTVSLSAFAYSPSIWTRAISRLLPQTTVEWRAAASAIYSAIKYLINAHGLDVVEIEESFGWSLPISRLLPVVVRLHGPWFLNGAFEPHNTNDASRRRQRMEGRGILNATLISAPSSEVLRAVRSHYNFRLSNACVIPNPLEFADDKEMWNLNDCDPNNILFIGRFDQRKGGDLVVRVFAELGSIYPDLTLTFVGPDFGITGPDNKLLSLRNFVDLTVPDRCRSRIIFCGQMPHSKVMLLRRRSFLTVVASKYEIMPYVVLEAMSLGCPIVATSVGGIPEMIQDGRNGLLVPPEEVGKMVEACRTLIDDPAFAASIGRQSWNDCRELYCPSTVAEQTANAYRIAIDTFKFKV